MNAVHIGFVNHLGGVVFRVQRRVVVGPEAVDRQTFGAAHGERAAGVHRHVVALLAAQAGGIQVDHAAVFAAGAHIQSGAVRQHQAAFLGSKIQGGPVAAFDGAAVAVALKRVAAGVEHRVALDGEVVAGGQPQAAGVFAAGAHRAGHGEAAAVGGHRQMARLQFVTDNQIAAAQGEVPAVVEAAVAEPLVKADEVEDGQALHLNGAALEAVVRLVLGAGDQVPFERHLAVGGGGLDGAGVAAPGGHVQGGAGGLAHIALAAFQHDIAAEAVAGHIEEGDFPAGHVQHAAIGEFHVFVGVDVDAATGRGHGAVDAHPVAVQGQAPAQVQAAPVHRFGALRSRHGQITAAAEGHVGTGLAGEHRRVQGQVAALVLPVPQVALIHGDHTFPFAGDSLRRVELDVLETEHQPVQAQVGGLVDHRAVEAEHHFIGVHPEAAGAGTGATLDHRARLRRHRFRVPPLTFHEPQATPGEPIGAQGGGIALAAQAIDRRGDEAQIGAGLTGGGIEGIQAHRAEEINGIGSLEAQTLDAGALGGAQQAVQNCLGKAPATGQHTVGGGLIQGAIRTHVDALHAQQQVAGAHGDLTDFGTAGGQQRHRALAEQAGAVLHAQAALALDAAERHQVVAHRQQGLVLVGVQNHTVIGGPSRRAAPPGINGGAGFDHHRSLFTVAGQQHRRRVQ